MRGSPETPHWGQLLAGKDEYSLRFIEESKENVDHTIMHVHLSKNALSRSQTTNRPYQRLQWLGSNVVDVKSFEDDRKPTGSANIRDASAVISLTIILLTYCLTHCLRDTDAPGLFGRILQVLKKRGVAAVVFEDCIRVK